MLKVIPCVLFLLCVAVAKSTEMAPNLKTALQKLNTQTQFVDFDLGLTEAEKQQFAKLTIKPGTCYDNYGNLSELIVSLTIFFESVGNNYDSSYAAAKVIHKIVKKMVRDLNTESFWLSMRLPNKSDYFDIPRWHIDGHYYKPYTGLFSKIFLTLKGRTTLFYNASPRDRQKFDEIFYCKVEDKDEMGWKYDYYGHTEAGRRELDKFIDHSKVYHPPLYTGTALLSGDKEATIHSEPPIHEDRIFISILPGNKEQIQYLQNQQNK